jgi:hypothetical protein
MISTVFVLGAIFFVFMAMQFHLFRRYRKTGAEPSLYLGVTCFLWALASFFGILISITTSLNILSLTVLFYRISTTSGLLAYVFLNLFAIAMLKSYGKKRKIWIILIPFFIVILIIWVFDPVVEGIVRGTTEFTLPSLYKNPKGLPLIEAVFVSMVVIAIYPVYLLFQISKATKDPVVKLKSLLMGIGMFVGTMAYAVEVTSAVSYRYMPIYRPMIFVGAFLLYFGYMMPKSIQRKLLSRVQINAELVDSFIEEFFRYRVTPNVKIRSNAFSESIGLTHEQLRGRKFVLEFDPSSHYEKFIQDFINEALVNGEPIVVFTRRGSPVYAHLRQQKGVKFFCMSQQISGPRIFSETEVHLPLNNTPLILNVFDKLLRSHPEQRVNLVFDSLSDLLLSVGFEKTYKFMMAAAEILAPVTVTAVFLLNRYAHDAEVKSSLIGLFGDQISFGKNGIETVKLSKERVIGIESYQGGKVYVERAEETL